MSWNQHIDALGIDAANNRSFIRRKLQEAREKAEEINIKTEKEFMAEKLSQETQARCVNIIYRLDRLTAFNLIVQRLPFSMLMLFLMFFCYRFAIL